MKRNKEIDYDIAVKDRQYQPDDNDSMSSFQFMDTFDYWIEQTLLTVSDNSGRVYEHTYRSFRTYCEQQGLDCDQALTPEHIDRFMASENTTRATRNRQLSALRKLAYIRTQYSDDIRYLEAFYRIKLMKTPEANLSDFHRERRILSNSQANAIVQCFIHQERDTALRNTAMMLLLFYTGLRRAELVSLKWQDIQWENGTLYVNYGKNNKSSDIAILDGKNRVVLDALERWKQQQFEYFTYTPDFIFTPIPRSQKRYLEDNPISVRTVHQVVDMAEKYTGIEFSSHDIRRTVGTKLITEKMPLQEVQSQLRHQHGSTTLQNYAIPAQAKKRRKDYNMDY